MDMKLKSCPFCGGDARLGGEKEQWKMNYFSCPTDAM